MKEIEKKKETLINVAYYSVILILVYYFVKYALWLFLPIIIAFLIAMVLQKPVNAIAKKTPIKKGLASVFCVFFVLFVLVGIIVGIGASVVNYLKDFIAYLTALFENTSVLLANVENWCLDVIAKLPDGISELLSTNVGEFFDSIALMLGESKEDVVQGASQSGFNFDLSWIKTPMASVVSTAKQLPSVLTSILITLIASCFLTADFHIVSEFVRRQMSEKSLNNFDRAKQILKSSLGKIVKAYCLIILVTFTELMIGLSVLKLIGVFNSSYIVIIAAATAIIDIVPVLGTGTVIFPWALYSVIVGNYGLAVGLVIIYVVMAVIRQVIEPKLVAGQLGLPPFLTIIGMYVGLKLFGFLGMFIMPIAIIMLKLFNEEGIIHIWKNKSDVEKVEEEVTGSEIKSSEEQA